jgi:excisionase family DNA binding protein
MNTYAGVSQAKSTPTLRLVVGHTVLGLFNAFDWSAVKDDVPIVQTRSARSDILILSGLARLDAEATMKTERPKSPTKFYTIEQIAECVEASTRTARRWIKQGLLVAYRMNGLLRVSAADFQKFLDDHRDA